jgi:omega-6 fatty acid desaturase (delta-12 desaturase)
MSELHSVIPKHLYQKNTGMALLYVARDILCAVAVYKLGWLIDPFAHSLEDVLGVSSVIGSAVKWSLWVLYWYCQSVILAGWWCMAHEAGHGSLSSYNWVNHFIGFTMHTVRISASRIYLSYMFFALNIVRLRPVLRMALDPPCPPQSHRVH